MPTAPAITGTALTPRSEETRIYEIAVLYPFPMGQKEEQDLLKAIDEHFAEAGAAVVMKDAWGRRGLAYNIGGLSEGTFVIYYVDMPAGSVRELDRQLRILKGLLRHMIIKPPKHYRALPYAKLYTQWQEDRVHEGERAVQEREEKLKQRVLEKAKRQTKRTEAKKKDEKPEAKKPASAGSIDAQLNKLISDDDLDL